MCGSDEKTRHEPQSKWQKLFVRIQALVFFCLAIYTIYSLFVALQQATRENLLLQENPPDDRCVPFFDDVKAFVSDAPLARGAYDYRNGDAIVRICSNETEATIKARVGPQFAYDPWKFDTGCDVLGTDQAAFLANCEMVGYDADATCQQLLDIAPGTFGVHWNGYAELLTGNRSSDNTAYPACSIKVTRISSISNCTYDTMLPMHDYDSNVALLIKISIAVPFIVMALQAFAVYKYSKTWAAEDGWMLAFACRGVPGSIYMLFWVCKEGDQGRGEFPDVFFNFWGWLACAIQDAFEGLAVPLVAILGCSLTRYPLNAALVVLKGLKFLFDLFMYLKNRNETSEPGGEDEQRALWASNPPKPDDEDGEMTNKPSPPMQMHMGQQSTPGYNNQQPRFPQPHSYPTNAV